MVREISGDRSAKWPEPLKSKETPEPPILPSGFTKENAKEWLTKLKEFMQWGIDNWDDPSVQRWVYEVIDYQTVNVYFTEDNYEMSTEILREGLKIPYTSQRFGQLQMLVLELMYFPEIDPENLTEKKESLEFMVNTLDKIL